MNSSVVGAQRPLHQRVPVGSETSAGLDAVELARLAGLTLDDWQSWFLRTSLNEAGDRWAAFEVALIVPRQNGKGALLEARQLAGLFLTEEPLQVHSAHEFKTAFEHFLRIANLVEGCPDLDRKVMRIRRGAGEQAIELKNGCRLRFLARSTGSGRGLTGDSVYLDEAFALTTAMMGALLPTLSAVPNPQVWYTSSAPMEASTVLHSLRARGRSGDDRSDRLFYAEWGLDPGADTADPENWALTNPALGIRITPEFVRSEFEAMVSMPDEFGRERLGIAQGGVEGDNGPIAGDAWDALVDPESKIESNRAIALDVSPDRRWSSLAWAGRRADGLLHVEAFDTRPGTDWIVPACVALKAKWKLPIRVQTGSPAAGWITTLCENGVEVVSVSSQEHAQAVVQVLDAIDNRRLRHLGGATLSTAAKNADVRPSGDVELWARRSSKVNITPIVAVTLAVGGVPAAPPQRLFVAVT